MQQPLRREGSLRQRARQDPPGTGRTQQPAPDARALRLPCAGLTLEGMGKLALLAFAVLLPTLTGGAILASVRGFRRLSRLRQDRRPQQAENIHVIEARLRRLRADLEATENQPGGAARRHHILALRGAYLDVLGSACQRLGVSPPAGGDQAGQAEIYRVEAALRDRGLDVREAAVR